MSFLDSTRDAITKVVTPFYVLRAPLIAAAGGAVMLSMPSQAQEIYRALALGPGESRLQIILAFVTLGLAGTFIWYVGRNLTLQWRQATLASGGVESWLLRWMPRLIGCVPIIGAGIGLRRAAEGIPNLQLPDRIQQNIPGLLEEILAARTELQTAQSALLTGVAICAAMAVVLLVVTYVRSRKRQWKYERPNQVLFSLGVRSTFSLMALAMAGGLTAFFLVSPRHLSWFAGQVGALAIFNTFMICSAFFLGFLTNIYDRTRVPVLSGLAIVALLSSAFNLNDNHIIRTLDKATITPPRGADAERALLEAQSAAGTRIYQGAGRAFERWLESRPDRRFYSQRGLDYPVYIVAAQSGGLYAAYQAAMTLARLQDRCAAFAQHVFAISGVSGGSLGAALFSSLVKERNEPRSDPGCAYGELRARWYQDHAELFLSQDFMASLTAAGFFPDFVQRFLPFPIGRFDRARALEASFERAWDVALPKAHTNPFAASYNQAWDPAGPAPALVLNTTWVKTGDRAVFSPFHFYGQTSDRVQTLQTLLKKPVALSTAVGVSARFPWVLPAASWKAEGRVRRRPIARRTIKRSPSQSVSRFRTRYFRFVDGGYFEYSGVETALDIIQVIDTLQESRRIAGRERLAIKVNLIVLSDDESVEDALGSGNFGNKHRAIVARSGFGELASPVEALLNSRLSRASLSVTRAVNRLCPRCYRSRRDRRLLPGFDGDARIFRLNLTDFPLTLGWQLSSAARRLIAAHTGKANKCFAIERKRNRSGRWFVKVINENNCAACRMVYDLSGRPQKPPSGATGNGADDYSSGRLHPYDLALPPEGRLLCQGEAG